MDEFHCNYTCIDLVYISFISPSDFRTLISGDDTEAQPTDVLLVLYLVSGDNWHHNTISWWVTLGVNENILQKLRGWLRTQ